MRYSYCLPTAIIVGRSGGWTGIGGGGVPLPMRAPGALSPTIRVKGARTPRAWACAQTTSLPLGSRGLSAE